MVMQHGLLAEPTVTVLAGQLLAFGPQNQKLETLAIFIPRFQHAALLNTSREIWASISEYYTV
jgi:hypothetical protein